MADALGQLMSEATSGAIRPQMMRPDPYALAVQQFKQKYPRLGQYPFVLTASPTDRSGNSETYEPDDPENPMRGKWNVQMRGEPYASHPESWPDLIGLESLHALQASDPKYKAMTEALINSFTPEQKKQADFRRQRDNARFHENQSLDNYLRRVHVQEFVRGRLFGPLFQKYEKGYDPNEWHYTPEQERLLSQIDQYMKTSK